MSDQSEPRNGTLGGDEPERKPSGRQRDAPAAPDVSSKRRCTDAHRERRDVPVKFFATLSDEEERARHLTVLRHWSHTQCWTLREMLGLDGNRPQSTIEWLVVCNYIIDFEFLLDEVPELISVPQVLVFYGTSDTPWRPWQAASPRGRFVHLDPSAAPGPENPLRARIPYGVHHSKMFLVGFADGTLRVNIHTANLRYSDVHLKAQAAYVQDFPLKADPGATEPCAFENSLVSYLQSYQFQEPLRWSAHQPPEMLVQRLRRYDYAGAPVVLIPSTPGYHPADFEAGRVALRHAVRAHAAPAARAGPIVCQFSSIGSLTEKYLGELQADMSAPGSGGGMPGGPRLRLVYPTVEEIRSSIQGYHGGGSVPGTVKNVSKPFLRSLFCRWSPSPSSSSPTAANPIHKPKNVPHIKTYFQLCPDNESLSWMVLSSHNLSKAAWGDIVNTRWGGRRLFIRHWELGVFLSPKLLGANRLVPWTDSDPPTGDAAVPLPYHIHPEPYEGGDQPWAVDVRYALPDRFGRLSVHDM